MLVRVAVGSALAIMLTILSVGKDNKKFYIPLSRWRVPKSVPNNHSKSWVSAGVDGEPNVASARVFN